MTQRAAQAALAVRAAVVAHSFAPSGRRANAMKQAGFLAAIATTLRGVFPSRRWRRSKSSRPPFQIPVHRQGRCPAGPGRPSQGARSSAARSRRHSRSGPTPARRRPWSPPRGRAAAETGHRVAPVLEVNGQGTSQSARHFCRRLAFTMPAPRLSGHRESAGGSARLAGPGGAPQKGRDHVRGPEAVSQCAGSCPAGILTGVVPGRTRRRAPGRSPPCSSAGSGAGGR